MVIILGERRWTTVVSLPLFSLLCCLFCNDITWNAGVEDAKDKEMIPRDHIEKKREVTFALCFHVCCEQTLLLSQEQVILGIETENPYLTRTFDDILPLLLVSLTLVIIRVRKGFLHIIIISLLAFNEHNKWLWSVLSWRHHSCSLLLLLDSWSKRRRSESFGEKTSSLLNPGVESGRTHHANCQRSTGPKSFLDIDSRSWFEKMMPSQQREWHDAISRPPVFICECPSPAKGEAIIPETWQRFRWVLSIFHQNDKETQLPKLPSRRTTCRDDCHIWNLFCQNSQVSQIRLDEEWSLFGNLFGKTESLDGQADDLSWKRREWRRDIHSGS